MKIFYPFFIIMIVINNENYDNNYVLNNVKQEKEKLNEEDYNEFTKEELQNINNLSKYFKNNCPSLYEKLENFEFLDSGGESNVYKTNIKNSKNSCTLKLIINDKREKKKKNIDEIMISKKLKNKNIINFMLYRPINKESECILMEHGTYGNLRHFLKKILKRNNFTESMLCYISFQILNGLKYLQNYKIVHYDIKPENIIIDNILILK